MSEKKVLTRQSEIQIFLFSSSCHVFKKITTDLTLHQDPVLLFCYVWFLLTYLLVLGIIIIVIIIICCGTDSVLYRLIVVELIQYCVE